MISIVEDNIPLPLGNNDDISQIANAGDEFTANMLATEMNSLWSGNGAQHLQDSLNDYNRCICLEGCIILSIY